MRIAFWLLQDSVREWRRWVAGLYYIKHCVEALALLPPGDAPEVVAFLPKSLGHDLVDSELRSRTHWLKTVRVPNELLESRRRRELATLVEQHPCDVTFPLIGMPPVEPPGRLIAWITDYQHKHYPQFFSPLDVAFRDNLYRFFIGVCDRIVSSSETVRQDLARFYDGVDGRDRVLRFATRAPDAVFATDPRDSLDPLGVPAEYVYLPNQFWVHKNHKTALEAWRKLRSLGHRYPLVCTGAKEDYRSPGHYQSLLDFLSKHKLDDTVKILGFVEREQQWQLYRGAKIVLQPSLFEGWSTSVEEAKCLGKPVVLSDITCHREQMGDAGRYFSTENPDQLAERIVEAWRDVPRGHELAHEPTARERALARMQQFGRDLKSLLAETAASPPRGIAASVLPFVVQLQSECDARISVIEELRHAADERLAMVHNVTAAANERLAVIRTLDHACRERAAKILQLERLLGEA